MITQEEIQLFKGRVIVVFHNENKDKVDYSCGRLVVVNKNSILLENLGGRKILIPFERIVKVKEKMQP